jgi:hypothetical protein
MGIQIREIRHKRDLESFLRFPWIIYRDDPHWVPPLLMERRMFLDPKKNPFFEHAEVRLFLATDQIGNPCGRIAAIVNHNHIRTHNEKAGCFGLFECVNDKTTAHALFGTAAAWLRSKGMEVMRGPENLCINDDLGLLVDGFDTPPAFMMPHNPPYYAELAESYGFAKAMDLYAYDGLVKGKVHERLQRAVEIARKRYSFRIRNINLKDFTAEVARLRDIYNQAWEKNWGAVAMTDREFDFIAKDMKMIMDPGLCLIAEVDGQPVGFALALPDMNQVLKRLDGRLIPFGILKFLYYKRKINRTRIITLGVIEKYRKMGIDSAFIHQFYVRSLEKGYLSGDMSWILETNAPMNNALLRLGYVVYKTYRIYDCRL